MVPNSNRNSLAHKLRRAVQEPRLVARYVRRRLRNRRIRARASSHPEFYREVMRADVRDKNARGAVGTRSRKGWRKLGRLQFEYLTSHGLERSHRLLEIGCGNLRAGWRLIKYLDEGNYVGVDISPDILIAAQQTIVDRRLQAKRPALFLVDGTSLDFLPDDHFDAVHAHSVFSHTPLEVVESYLCGARRVMKPGAFFDFTYNASDGEVWNFLEEDYYYPPSVLLELARELGFDGEQAADWTGHKQAKIRLRRPAAEAHRGSGPGDQIRSPSP